ncbi:hypothetical protein [Janthinobacterium sp. BJB401]|uniref:hypothetical protein n=1 Tax=Janthinobacterium sp. BJB401 TaxID=2745934 RepID=UPI0015955C7A|nr:hypothetical protein [Janthinobacterium sp. BJB401]NVI81906.1 hypothetical protein [Janthinobacterium sp. BJB401]
MDEQAIADTLKNLKAQGIPYAIEWMNAPQERDTRLAVAKWIGEEQRREQQIREDAQRKLTEEALTAAKISAETSRDAALAAKESAKWTMWTAVAAFMGLVVTFFQAVGWWPLSR